MTLASRHAARPARFAAAGYDPASYDPVRYEPTSYDAAFYDGTTYDAASHHPAYAEAFAGDGGLATLGFSPSERIGRPPARRGRAALRNALVLALLAGAGWAAFENQTELRAWSDFVVAHLPAELVNAAGKRTAALASPVPPPPPELPAPRTIEAPASPPVPAAAEIPPPPTAPDGASTDGPPADTPTAQPAVRSADSGGGAIADPLRRRAAAAGLHPDLSRALLERLSATDFKNAALAIKTALAETPEEGELVYPKTPQAGVARYRIHFVTGAGADCRRYVVAIAKDGWLTTALPMEKCGVRLRRASAQSGARTSAH